MSRMDVRPHSSWHTTAKHKVVTCGDNLVRSYDLENGELIWQCGGLSENTIPSPVVEGEFVYCMSGYKGYSLLALAALRPGRHHQ